MTNRHPEKQNLRHMGCLVHKVDCQSAGVLSRSSQNRCSLTHAPLLLFLQSFLRLSFSWLLDWFSACIDCVYLLSEPKVHFINFVAPAFLPDASSKAFASSPFSFSSACFHDTVIQHLSSLVPGGSDLAFLHACSP